LRDWRASGAYEYLRLCAALECDFKTGIDVLLRVKNGFSNAQSHGTKQVAEKLKPYNPGIP
jgi:hypothetical protein